MKFIHMSDLHIGKRLNEYSLIEDQMYQLQEIINYLTIEEVQVLLLSGDIYDTPIPSQEAVKLFDHFIVSLYELKIKVLMISGNHDAAERLQFGSRLFKGQGLYIQTSLDQVSEPIRLSDEYGDINFYLLPFIKPVNVAHHYGLNVQSYDEMMSIVLSKMKIDYSSRNVLLAHQFVTGGITETMTSESEIYSLGGLDNVSVNYFKSFDYVALGHVHRPQQIAQTTIRYSGSLLKYSISERNYDKSVVLVDFKAKNDVSVTLLPLHPLRDVVLIKAYFDDLEKLQNHKDYVQVELLDEHPIMDVVLKLRNYFSYLLGVSYPELNRSMEVQRPDIKQQLDDPVALFETFYRYQNERDLTLEQKQIVASLIDAEEKI